MSRRDNIIERKSKIKKISFITKTLFMMMMIFNLVFCTYIIDRNAKIMLGQTSTGININVTNIQNLLNEKIKEINQTSINIMKQFNKYY